MSTFRKRDKTIQINPCTAHPNENTRSVLPHTVTTRDMKTKDSQTKSFLLQCIHALNFHCIIK